MFQYKGVCNHIDEGGTFEYRGEGAKRKCSICSYEEERYIPNSNYPFVIEWRPTKNVRRLIQCDTGYEKGCAYTRNTEDDERPPRFIVVDGAEKVECELCGELYPKKRWDLGYKYCVECAEENTERYVGRRDDGRHDGTTQIFRTNTANIKRQIRRENAVGFAPNMPLSSTEK